MVHAPTFGEPVQVSAYRWRGPARVDSLPHKENISTVQQITLRLGGERARRRCDVTDGRADQRGEWSAVSADEQDSLGEQRRDVVVEGDDVIGADDLPEYGILSHIDSFAGRQNCSVTSRSG